LLASRGYHGQAIGKMHFTPVRERHGLDRVWLSEEIPAGPDEDEFLREMIAANRISQIEPDIKAYQRAKIQDEHDRDSGESTSDGKAARRAKSAAALLDAIDAAENGEPPPAKVKAPKPVRS
jgi:arylsulfatase A-like enzyme